MEEGSSKNNSLVFMLVILEQRWSDLKFGVKDRDFCLGMLSLRCKKDINWLYVVVQSSEKRSGQKRYIRDLLSN